MSDRRNAAAPPAADEFYVGYLPTPSRLSRFLWRIVPVLLMATAGVGGIIAANQRDPGQAVWDVDQPRRFEGVLRMHPYAALHVADSAGATHAHLLVSELKGGVAERLQGLDGARLALRGSLVQRGELRLISVLDDADAVQVIGPASPAPVTGPTNPSTRVTLRGEIVDPKCFGGAMKPGDGKGHKTCATLCIRGGIPPVFATPRVDGSYDYFEIVDESGNPFTGESLDALLPFVADPVEVMGDTIAVDGRQLLRLNVAAIRRL